MGDAQYSRTIWSPPHARRSAYSRRTLTISTSAPSTPPPPASLPPRAKVSRALTVAQTADPTPHTVLGEQSQSQPQLLSIFKPLCACTNPNSNPNPAPDSSTSTCSVLL